MDLRTSYLGLELKNPLIVSSSKLTGDLKNIKECVKYGASAIVLKSLFEEQIRLEAESKLRNSRDNNIYYWFPEAKEHVVGLSVEANLDRYLSFIKEVKAETGVPVISSINCQSAEEWPKFAKAIQDAGADALELNIAIFPFNNKQKSCEIEEVYFDILREVKKHVTIPVSVKLGYYFTNLCSVATRLVEEGADGLVLFNRYFRPDIDINTLKVMPDTHMSSPEELNVPLRWIALMTGNSLPCDLAASTGVHNHVGVVKQILAGAKAVQLCSTLYLNGINVIEQILKDLEGWMVEHRFNSIEEFRGKSLEEQTIDASFERIQFMRKDYE